MPSVRAASSALPRSREAIAVTSLHTPFCMPGMTFVTAIFAVLRIPQRTLDIARHHSRKGLGGKTRAARSRPPENRAAGQLLSAGDVTTLRFLFAFLKVGESRFSANCR